MRPIQNMVFDQVKTLAKELGYDYVLDKSGGVMIIYANEKHDITNTVLDRMKKLLPPRSAPGQQQQATQPNQPGQGQQRDAKDVNQQKPADQPPTDVPPRK